MGKTFSLGKRSVIKIGSSLYNSLPSTWIKNAKVKRGDELEHFLDLESGDLIIRKVKK